MKKIVFLFLCLIFTTSIALSDGSLVRTSNDNYEQIYESLEEADFNYIFGIDPYQSDEYTKYMYSPYPLFRTGVNIAFKSKIIPPGYYLLTPREKNGKTWVLFKENGRVSYTIPVYNIENVPDSFYEDKFPHPKLNAIQKMRKGSMEFIGKKWGKHNQRTPAPKAYVEFDDRGDFWDMILYYGDKKYYMIFKKV